ncbi:hypothetical protein FRX31_024115 [Thalictrum thalictroides]|uniref:Uncharacterized protein n=1 Tax=Thalictrum thalictroides TaxID=46969 RepID=A0A7J6VP08_THATH|nr:hypothetical protein FRX31_024115 [Thalictrum thalictroides]
MTLLISAFWDKALRRPLEDDKDFVSLSTVLEVSLDLESWGRSLLAASDTHRHLIHVPEITLGVESV